MPHPPPTIARFGLVAAAAVACLLLARLAPSAPAPSRVSGGANQDQPPVEAHDALTLLARPGGYFGAAEAEGKFALVNADHRLYRYDLSDPLAPRRVGVGPYVDGRPGLLPGNLGHLVLARGARDGAPPLYAGLVDWDRLPLVDEDSRLKLVIVQDLAVIGQLDLPFFTTVPHRQQPITSDLASADDGLLLVAGTAGDGHHIRLVDIANPAAPRLVGDHRPTGPPLGMASRAGLAYVLEGGGWGEPARLVTLDLSAPTAPRVMGSLLTVTGAMNVALGGGHAFVVGCGGLDAFDLADPARPRKVGETMALLTPTQPGAGPTAVPPTSGVQCDAGDDVIWRDGRLYAVMNRIDWLAFRAHHALWIIDVNRPDAPRVLASRPGRGGISRIAIGDGFALLAGDGLRRVDIDPPEGTPGQTELFPGSKIHGAVAAAAVLVAQSVADEWGSELQLLDPRSPGLLGRLPMAASRPADDLAIDGGTVHVLYSGRGMDVVDASDPRAPRQTALLPERATMRAVAAWGGFAYVAESNPGGMSGEVRVIDARDRSQPVEVGSLPGAVDDLVALDGRLILATVSPPGLAIFDLRDPARPVLAGRRELSRRVLAITALRDRIYAVAGGELLIVDMTEPAAPRLLGRRDLREACDVRSCSVQGIAAVGDTVYLSTYRSIRAIDVGDPSAPRAVGGREIPAFIDLLAGPLWDGMPTGGGIAASAGAAHVAGDRTGLWSFGLDPARLPAWPRSFIPHVAMP